MLENYQEQKALETAEPLEAAFATIGTIYADGVTLIFDGAAAESAKHYKVNSFVVFAAGDRVRIVKDSGTYVVEYPVGTPKTSFAANSASTATNFTGKHTGSSIGFFNYAATTRKAVGDLTATPTVDNLKTKLNALIDALQAYGLIT